MLMTGVPGSGKTFLARALPGILPEMSIEESLDVTRIYSVADYSYWVVRTTDLTEMDVVKLKEDQSVIVTLDTIPDTDLAGTIDSIGQTFSENQGDVVYEVIITLTDTHLAMRWGMTAEVKFE